MFEDPRADGFPEDSTLHRLSMLAAKLGAAAMSAGGSVTLVLVAIGGGQQQSGMTGDVLRMIRAAEKVARLMPWSSPVPEVDRVVRHGKAVAPLLIRLLPDDPDDPNLSSGHFDERKILAGEQFEWRVEQNAAVALCRIYRASVLGSCPMYGVRSSRESNRAVRSFWVKTIQENP